MMRNSRTLLLACCTCMGALATGYAAELVEVKPTHLTPVRAMAPQAIIDDTSHVVPASNSAQLSDPVPAAPGQEAQVAEIPAPTMDVEPEPLAADAPGLLNIGKGGKGLKGGGHCFHCFEHCGWTVYADAVFLKRENDLDSRVLFTDNFNSDHPVADLDDLNFDREVGFRVGAIAHNACGADLEIIYFGIDTLSASLAAEGDINQYRQADLYGQVGLDVDAFGVRYDTKFDSFEALLRHCWSDNVTLLTSFRYFELDDRLSIGDRFTAGATQVEEGIFTHAENRLFGFQIGADVGLMQSCRSAVNLTVKTGVYYNDVDVDSGWDFLQSEFHDSDGKVAFIGEALLGGTYNITPCLHVRGGYQVLWIQNVALGADHIDHIDHFVVPAEGDIRTDDVLFHGGYFGAEWVF